MSVYVNSFYKVRLEISMHCKLTEDLSVDVLIFYSTTIYSFDII